MSDTATHRPSTRVATPDLVRQVVQEVREQYGIPAISIITLEDLIEHVANHGRESELQRLRDYRARYGV